MFLQVSLPLLPCGGVKPLIQLLKKRFLFVFVKGCRLFCQLEIDVGSVDSPGTHLVQEQLTLTDQLLYFLLWLGMLELFKYLFGKLSEQMLMFLEIGLRGIPIGHLEPGNQLAFHLLQVI